MATRCYFPDGVSAPVTPPSPGAEWEHNNGATAKLLFSTPDNSALNTIAYTPDSADDLTNKDSMHRQYVSDPLAAQTISGNIKAQFQCLETFANDNLFLTLVIKVISNNGTTVRATLLAITRDTTNELATSITNRNFPSTALTPYTCVSGDRLLIEVGLGGSISSGTGGVIGHNGSIRWGCSASSGDLPEDDIQTGATYRSWLEFSNNLILPTRSRISWTEFEAPFKATRARFSFTELEVPFLATRARVSFTEFELPIALTRARVSWAELEVPATGNPTRGRISFSEFQIPFVQTRARISHAELESPLAPTRGRLSFAELESPLAPTRGRNSWSEFETPLLQTRGRISHAETEIPFAPTRGRISQAESEVPFQATRGRSSGFEMELPIAPTRGRISWTEFEISENATTSGIQTSKFFF